MLIFKLAIASTIIAFASWLSGKKPELAGFIIALPITSLMVLVFSQIEHQSDANSISFAKSIMVGVPVSWLFFLPFFFADKLGGSFWMCYGVGALLLVGGFFIHRLVMGYS